MPVSKIFSMEACGIGSPIPQVDLPQITQIEYFDLQWTFANHGITQDPIWYLQSWKVRIELSSGEVLEIPRAEPVPTYFSGPRYWVYYSSPKDVNNDEFNLGDTLNISENSILNLRNGETYRLKMLFPNGILNPGTPYYVGNNYPEHYS